MIDLKDARLQELSGGWCASVLSTRDTLSGTVQELLAFELGLPGEVRSVPACGGRAGG